MRNDPTGCAVCAPPTDRLHDVEVVRHVIEGAIVRQTVEESPNSIFCGHVNLRDAASIRPASDSAKFVNNVIGGFAHSNDQRSPAGVGCKPMLGVYRDRHQTSAMVNGFGRFPSISAKPYFSAQVAATTTEPDVAKTVGSAAMAAIARPMNCGDSELLRSRYGAAAMTHATMQNLEHFIAGVGVQIVQSSINWPGVSQGAL